MKTKTTLLIGIILLVNGIRAKASDLNLTIVNHYNNAFFVQINNTSYQTNGNIKINNLPVGSNKINIIKQEQFTSQDINGRIITSTQDVIVYNGVINIPPNAEVSASLEFANLVITQVVPKRLTTSRIRTRNRPNTRIPRRTYNTPVVVPMYNQQFNALLNAVKQTHFESDKLNIIQIALNNNFFNSTQVALLMDQFSFDSGKLTLAKQAYGNTVDKENYFVVSEKLTFGSSKKELTEFILNQRF